MLVRCFEIHVSRIAQLGMQSANGFMRNTAINPNVDCVSAFPYIRRQSEFLRQSGIVQFKPNVRAALGYKISQTANNF